MTDGSMWNKALVRVLKDTHERHVIPRRERARENVQTAMEVLQLLIKTMALSDDKFRRLHVKPEPVNGYYPTLKVVEPNEIDFTLLLSLPWIVKGRTGFGMNKSPFPGYRYMQCVMAKRVLPDWMWCLDVNHKVMNLSKVATWMHGCMVKAFFVCKKQNLMPNVQMVEKKGTFEMRIIIDIEDGPLFVDVAPGIQGMPGLKAPSNKKDDVWNSLLHATPADQPLWFLSAKPPPPNVAHPDARRHMWRVEELPAEHRLFAVIDVADGGCRRRMYQLLKVLQASQQPEWRMLRPYCFKQIVLRFLKKREGNFWHPDNMGNAMYEILLKLQKSLQSAQKELPQFWAPKVNIVRHISSDELAKIVQRLRELLANIERDPNTLAHHIRGVDTVVAFDDEL